MQLKRSKQMIYERSATSGLDGNNKVCRKVDELRISLEQKMKSNEVAQENLSRKVVDKNAL